MSQPSEQISVAKQYNLETNSESETESEEGSTASEDDTFLSIQFPSPPNFHTPYLRNWDFGDSDKALKYITKNINYETVIKSLWSFPNLSGDPLYYHTFVDSG